jgi:hypothetical protein
VLQLRALNSPGIHIGATLTLAQTDFPFVTGPNDLNIRIGQATENNAFLFGSPANFFFNNSKWVPPSQDQLSNLDVPPGGSAHLDLGSVVLSAGLPNGTYTTDIGVFVACQATFCSWSLFSPPTIDAGLLTITVAAPEPAAIFLVGTALLGLVVASRSRLRRTV